MKNLLFRSYLNHNEAAGKNGSDTALSVSRRQLKPLNCFFIMKNNS
jgi:hypothetical protein